MAKGYMASDYRYLPSSVRFETRDGALERLFGRCEQLCRENIRMFGCRKVLQEGAKYRGVWLETQPLGGEMYAKRDMEAALNNQLIFMEYQRRDGRMPGMITCRMPFDGVAVHQDWMQGDFFTIPAFKMYYHIGRDEEYLKRLYTAVRDFDEYLWEYRDSDGDGCLEAWCMWDTGDDNNTRYLVQGIDAVKDGAWNGEAPPDGGNGLPLESAEYMAYSYAHRDVLAKISDILGNGEGAVWRSRAEQVRRRFRERLWDGERCFAFDRNAKNEKIDCLSMSTVKCMYQGILTQEMADAFISRHMMDPGEFFTPMPLPNNAVNDPLFFLNSKVNNLSPENLEKVRRYSNRDMDDNSWAGPVQGLIHQRALPALLRYGHHAETVLIAQRWIENLEKYGKLVQQYDPFTGMPAPGEEGYGPTLLATLEYAAHLYGAVPGEGRVLWSAHEGPYESRYEQRMYGRCYALERSGGIARAFVDGREAFAVTQGVRVESGPDGEPERLFGMEDGEREVVLTAGGREHRAKIRPNEEMRPAGGELLSVRRVPFGARR